MLELPEISGGDFEDTLAKLKKQIPSLCPEWVNTSESSPGIMLLELLTYISLEQRKSMNKIGGKALFDLGRLMGYEPERLSPAHTMAKLPAAAASGEKLRIDSLVFETRRDFSPLESKAVLFGRCDENNILIPLCSGTQKLPEQRLFDKSDNFVIGFDKPLGDKKEIRIALCFDTQGRAIPHGLSKAPWGDIVRWQYYSVSGWRDAEIISDSTLSCFMTGELVLRINGHAQLDGVYPIRCTADREKFDLLPLLTGVYTDACPVIQTDTKCACVTFGIEAFKQNKMVFSNALAKSGVFRLFVNSTMGWCSAEDMNIAFDVVREHNGFRLATSSRKDLAELFSELDGSEVLMLVMYEQEYVRDFTQFSSDGSANQHIPLNFSGVLAPETELMAAQEQDGVLYWHKWRWSDKLSLEPPESSCFTINAVEESIVFGDRVHGAIPQSCGKKNILLTSLKLTSGAQGNISPCPARSSDGGTAEIISTAQGGFNEDTPDSFFARTVNSPKPGTLLTLSDYERAAMQTEGVLLKTAQAYCTRSRAGNLLPNAVTLLVEPRTGRVEKSLSGLEWITDLIKQRLDELKTINTRISVIFPKYIPINVTFSFESTGFSTGAQSEAELCIRSYFDENCGGELDSSRLLKRLAGLSCVSAVRSLELSEPAMGGRFTVPEGCRVYLRNCDIYCTNRR